MPSDDTRRLLLRAAAVVAAVYLTVGVLVLVPDPAGGPSRLATTAAAIALAWIGVLGVVRERTLIAELGAVGLAVLGLWQAIAWVFMLPTGAVLAVAAVAMARAQRADDGEGSDGDEVETEREVGGGDGTD